MGSLEQFTRGVINKVIAEDYPHFKLPAVTYATITGAKELSDTYKVDGLMLTNTDTGGSFQASVTAHWHEYTLRVIDRNGYVDGTYPALPGVRSRLQLQAGAIVAVGFAFGSEPTIIGAVVL